MMMAGMSDPSHRFSQVASSGCDVPTFTSFDSTTSRGRRRTVYALLSKKACGVGRWPWPHHASCRLPPAGRRRWAAKDPLFCVRVFWRGIELCCVLCGASWMCTVLLCVSYRIAYCARRGPRSARGDRSDPAIVRIFMLSFCLFLVNTEEVEERRGEGEWVGVVNGSKEASERRRVK